MPHLDTIIALGTEAADDPGESRETHLCLTAYRTLYVANVTAITTKDPRASDTAHVADYYATFGLACDCW